MAEFWNENAENGENTPKQPDPLKAAEEGAQQAEESQAAESAVAEGQQASWQSGTAETAGNSEGNRYQWNSDGQYRYSAGAQNQDAGFRQNQQESGYGQQNFQYQTGQAAGGGPERKKKKKEKKTGKKTGRRVAAAVLITALVLGIVGGGYVGIRYAVETWIPNLVAESTNSTQSESGSQSATLNKGGTIADTDTSSVMLLDVSDVAASVMPSVVSITNTMVYTSESIFGTMEQTGSGAGSGVIISQNDTELMIVTNSHVINGEENANYTVNTISLKVQFIDGTVVDAAVKGDDPDMDLAVISVPLSSLEQSTKDAIKIAEIGDSDSMQIGNGVIAVGNAMGTGQSVTVGYLSATDRTITYNDVEHQVLQVDAAINPGNSGGGLFNTAGQLIGINEAKYNSSEAEGMGYAIPITGVEDIINELINQETKTPVEAAKQGYLGIRGSNVTSEWTENYGIPTGIFVSEVVEGGPASSSDLQVKDIITAIGGQKVKTMTELQKQLTYLEGGTTVELTVQRLNDQNQYEEKTVEVTLGYKADAQ